MGRLGNPASNRNVLGSALADLAAGDRRSETGRQRTALTVALLSNDLHQAGRIVRAARTRLPLAVLFDDVLAAALRDVGSLWERETITIADEHAATALARRLVDLVAGWLPPAMPGTGTALLATPPSERHDIALAMADAVLRSCGFDALNLGSDLPASELERALIRHRPTLIALSATIVTPPELEATLRVIRRTAPETPVLLGGAATAGVSPSAPVHLIAGMRELLAVLQTLDPSGDAPEPAAPHPRGSTQASRATAPGSRIGATWMPELMLRKSEAAHTRQALLEIAEELSLSASWMWDTASDHVEWSDNVYRVLDLDPSDPPPGITAFLDRVHPDDRDRVTEILQQASDGMTVDQTYRVLSSRGTTRVLRAVTAARLGGPGAPIVVGWLHDVTRNHDADRHLAAHLAVTDVLRSWSSLTVDGPRLLRGLATALGFSRAALWAPAGRVLVPLIHWEQDEPDTLAAELSSIRLSKGQGLAGRAWEHRTPLTVPDLLEGRPTEITTAALARGLRGAVSLPLLTAGDVVAVITLAGTDVIELDPRWRATLDGLAHELGTFLAARRGELRPAVLSPRELQILQLAADGLSGPEIASRLHLSPTTVKTHFENIYQKYGARDRVSAVARALREGLIN